MLIEPFFFLSHELKCYPRYLSDLIHAEGAGGNGGQEPASWAQIWLSQITSWVTLDNHLAFLYLSFLIYEMG